MRPRTTGAIVAGMEVVIHLESSVEPVTGWLRTSRGAPSLPFIGYLELLTELERLRTAPPPAADGSKEEHP